MNNVEGFCQPEFQKVHDAFVNNFEAGREVGASVAIAIEGELVVDLWGGHTDESRTQAWESDTITNVWSSTKTMMFLTFVYLADKGLLNLHDKVSKYWPEFAQNGKQDIEIRHLMAHTAGIPGFVEPMTWELYEDHDYCARLLERQAPWWEPGTASGYHAINQGFPLGEIVKRITGKSLGQVFKENIADPLNADFHIGTGPEFDHRCSWIIPMTGVEPVEIPEDSITFKTFTNPPFAPEMALSLVWRRAEVGAANGHGNARSMAMIQSLMSNGGSFGGKRIFSEEAPNMVLEEQSNGIDLVIGTPVRFGMGYALGGKDSGIPGNRTCYWGGWGGSLVINDLDRRMTFTYAMNRMDVGSGSIGDERGLSMLAAAYSK